MHWYACKFCFVLYGPPGERNQLATTRGKVLVHVRVAHGFPGRSAAEILASYGKGEFAVAAHFIEKRGPIVLMIAMEAP